MVTETQRDVEILEIGDFFIAPAVSGKPEWRYFGSFSNSGNYCSRPGSRLPEGMGVALETYIAKTQAQGGGNRDPD